MRQVNSCVSLCFTRWHWQLSKPPNPSYASKRSFLDEIKKCQNDIDRLIFMPIALLRNNNYIVYLDKGNNKAHYLLPLGDHRFTLARIFPSACSCTACNNNGGRLPVQSARTTGYKLLVHFSFSHPDHFEWEMVKRARANESKEKG